MFIYDMAGSQYTNFELDLSKKILNLLKVTARGDPESGDGHLLTEYVEVCGFGVNFHTRPMLTTSRLRSTGSSPRGPQEGIGSLPGWTRGWEGISCPRAGFLSQLLAALLGKQMQIIF